MCIQQRAPVVAARPTQGFGVRVVLEEPRKPRGKCFVGEHGLDEGGLAQTHQLLADAAELAQGGALVARTLRPLEDGDNGAQVRAALLKHKLAQCFALEHAVRYGVNQLLKLFKAGVERERNGQAHRGV